MAININTVFHYHDKSFFIICDYVLWEGKKGDPKKLNGIDTTNRKMQREKKAKRHGNMKTKNDVGTFKKLRK